MSNQASEVAETNSASWILPPTSRLFVPDPRSGATAVVLTKTLEFLCGEYRWKHLTAEDAEVVQRTETRRPVKNAMLDTNRRATLKSII